jgi:RNA polymerase sigma-70 factor (ECF subfamily)
MAHPTDDDLVRRSQQGDEEAFAELVGRYRRLVFGIIARTIGDAGRAEDLAQDVFLRMHRGLPYFRGTARVSTWIYRIAVNVCLQDRATPKRIALRISEEGDDEDRTARQVGGKDAAFGTIELRDRLSKALARLPANYRLLVAAHYLRGVQYDELAGALNLPLGTVKTHLYRARRELRKLLEGELA